jgi:hypothetical protein
VNPFSITSGRRRLYCGLRPKGVFLEAMPKAGDLLVGVPRVGVPRVGVPRVGVPRVGVPRVGVPRVGVPRVGVPRVGEVWVDELSVGAPLADELQADAGDKSDNCPRKGEHQCKRPAVCRNTAL